jgi:hypothetical protein
MRIHTALVLIISWIELPLLASTIVIANQNEDHPLVGLAAREVQRYLYLRTGRLASLSQPPKLAADISVGIDPALKPQEYCLKTTAARNRKSLKITGGSEQAVLYGAYSFAEKLGVRFYLHGDELPDQQSSFQLPDLDEKREPLFDCRGIQPFHDFTEGPDWWEAEDYQAYFAQLVKMKMNFAGFHCYPEGGVGPEPLIWIGLPEDIQPDAKVSFSYPSRWASTMGGAWGYASTPTRDFSAGSSMLFETDDFGPSVTAGQRPIPKTPEACNEVFNRAGKLLAGTFGFGRQLGIKICLGTETPITLPKLVEERLRSRGLDPKNPEVVSQVYEGLFRRIKQVYPVDYYWLWTPEDWTWSGNKPQQLADTVQDIKAALNALDRLGNPFTLATCGWVLGPQSDRAALDRVLPAKSPMSCINRNVGFDFVETAFSRLEGRPKWAIPWMEDDPDLAGIQLWVGRNRRDAADAAAYGCTGLLGIHWRTKSLAPNFASLAQAAWDQKPWNPNPGKRVNRDAVVRVNGNARDFAVEDFYRDWVRSQFGDELDGMLTGIFIELDGGRSDYSTNKDTHIPRPTDWIEGPGGVKSNPRSWSEESTRYAFVAQMELLRSHIKGKANLARFDYWLNQFRYLRSLGELGCTRGLLDAAVKEIEGVKDPAQKKKAVLEKALKLRVGLARLWEEMMTHLLQTVSTPGELGTIANLEQHTRRNPANPPFLSLHDQKLVEWAGAPLPADIEPTRDYLGPPRLIVPACPSILNEGEKLSLKVIVLDQARPQAPILCWRPMGKGKYRTVESHHVARGVYRVELPPAAKQGIEYFILAKASNGQDLIWPPAAPKVNQTVLALSPK